MGKHIHKYQLITVGYHKVMACAFADCNHHIPDYMKDAILRKFSICWSCEDKFIMTEEHRKLIYPVCDTCKKILKEKGIQLQ